MIKTTVSKAPLD